MGKQTLHVHPNTPLYQMQQIMLAALLSCAIVAALLLIVVAFVLSAPLFVVMSVLVFMLTAPLLMALVNTPPIIIKDDGLTLKRFLGNDRFIAWDEITRIDVYPLLPQANQEILKQYMIGRNKYRAAEGIMLTIPSLPLPYRIAGLLAAEQGMPIIALTNRTHTDYDILKNRITHHAAHAVQDTLTNEE